MSRHIGTSERRAAPRPGQSRVAAGGRADGRWRALLTLAATEGRLAGRHPLVPLALLVGAVLFREQARQHGADLGRGSVWLGGGLLPLAAAGFLAANLAVLRGRRYHSDELEAAMPLPAATRTAAHLLAVAAPVGVAVAAVAVGLAVLLIAGAVGTANLAELAVGPLLVGVAGVAGILVARWAPSTTIGPAVLVAAATFQLWPQLVTVSGPLVRVPWLAPWADLDGPRQLALRPAGWHALYLGALAGLGAVAALVRHGLTVRRVTAGLVALAVCGTAGVAQLRPPSSGEQAAVARYVERPEFVQRCQQRAAVRYCAYPGYARLIDRWAAIVTPVVEQLPATARARVLEVRQRASLNDLGGLEASYPSPLARRIVEAAQRDDRMVHPDLGWATQGDEQRLDLALQVGAWAVHLPTTEGSDGLCYPGGQARAVVALWLAGQADPRVAATLRRLVRDNPYDPSHAPGSHADTGIPSFTLPWARGGVDWPTAEAEYAVQLLDRPAAGAAIRAHWKGLAGPRESTDTLVRMLRLRSLPPLAEVLARLGTRPGELSPAELLAGYQRCS